MRAGYGRVPVLYGVDMTVGDGEIVGILGHNGMVKSTLMKTLMGLVPSTGGSIHLEGVDISRMPPHERSQLGIGYVPQGRGIFPMLSVLDNLRMGVAAFDDDENEAVRQILMDFPRLESLLDREGGALSGGEQQMLAIARCLISQPHLILLDEPTEGIQPSIIEAIIELLKTQREQRGLSILLVEQNLDFITELSDRALLLQKGEITGEVAGGAAANPALIAEFTGFGAGTGASAGVDLALEGVVVSAAMPATSSTPPAPSLMRPLPQQPQSPPSSRRLPAMTVQRPTHAQLKEIVTEFGMHISDERIGEFLAIMNDTISAYDVVDAMPDFLPSVDYPRTSGYRPMAEENPLNAWYVKTDIKGAPRGPLAGKTIALEDNVCLAGVPMM
ncbi:MAG: ATP-binding cassette domain-containing protein, partial [Geminicoccaceae bacterium]